MVLTSKKDLQIAFDMVDERKEGALDRVQARKWLRCCGWSLTDEDLDEMLMAVDAGRTKTRYGMPERTRWELKQLVDLADLNRDKANSSIEEVQNALTQLAGGKGKINRAHLVELATRGRGLTGDDIRDVLDVLDLGRSTKIDCAALAEKLLDRICNPPSSFEVKTRCAQR